MKFQILRPSLKKEHIHILGDPDGLTKPHLEGFGLPFGSALATSPSYRKDPEGGDKATDFLAHHMHSLVVSERALTVLREDPNPHELHPVTIKDERKGTTLDGYTLFHLLGTIDCVDRQQSKMRMSRLEPELAMAVNLLQLDTSKIPSARTLFRIKENPTIKIIREDLAQRLKDAGATGFELLELGAPVLL